jgi:hypothetical protein
LAPPFNGGSAGTSHSGSKLSGGLKTGKAAKTDTKIGSITALSKKEQVYTRRF